MLFEYLARLHSVRGLTEVRIPLPWSIAIVFDTSHGQIQGPECWNLGFTGHVVIDMTEVQRWFHSRFVTRKANVYSSLKIVDHTLVGDIFILFCLFFLDITLGKQSSRLQVRKTSA
jgi:hypothetical protein